MTNPTRVSRTRTDTMEGSGSGPTVEELIAFLAESPGSGRVAVHHHEAEDARDSTGWRITVTSQPDAAKGACISCGHARSSHTRSRVCGPCSNNSGQHAAPACPDLGPL